MTTTGPDPTPRGQGARPGWGLRYPATALLLRGAVTVIAEVESHQGEDNKPFLPWANSACKHQQREALRGRGPAGLSSRTAVPAPHAAPVPLTRGRRPGRRREQTLCAPLHVPGPARLPGAAGRLAPGAVRQRGAPAAPPPRAAMAACGRGGGGAGLLRR